MVSTLFTIGFTQKTAEQFFGLLQDAGVQRAIDIRENRVGQLSGFAKYPDIAFFLDRLLGIEYVYEPLLAPSENPLGENFVSFQNFGERRRAGTCGVSLCAALNRARANPNGSARSSSWPQSAPVCYGLGPTFI